MQAEKTLHLIADGRAWRHESVGIVFVAAIDAAELLGGCGSAGGRFLDPEGDDKQGIEVVASGVVLDGLPVVFQLRRLPVGRIVSFHALKSLINSGLGCLTVGIAERKRVVLRPGKSADLAGGAGKRG